MGRALLVLVLLVTVSSTALEARSTGANAPPERPDCHQVQLPPGTRLPLGARPEVIGRCELELRRRLVEEAPRKRSGARCEALASRSCATAPVTGS